MDEEHVHLSVRIGFVALSVGFFAMLAIVVVRAML